MSMRLALVLDGDNEGAKRALNDTSEGVEKLGDAARRTAEPVKGVADELDRTADAGGRAAPKIEEIGQATDSVEPKLIKFKTLLVGTIAGIAAGFATAGVTAAIGAASAAFGAFAAEILTSSPQIDRALETHENLIKRIKGAYAGAEDAASSYGANTLALLTFEAERNIAEQQTTLARLQSELVSGGIGQQLVSALPFGGGVNSPFLQAGGTPFEQSVRNFLDDLGQGTADVAAFRNEIASIANALPFGDDQRGLADRLIGNTDQLAEAQVRFQQSIDQYQGLTGDAEAMSRAIGGSTETIAEQRENMESALPVMREYRDLLDAISAASGGMGGRASVSTMGVGFELGPGYAMGGWTGPSARDQIAGFVHGQEYVFDAETTARIGVSNLDAIRAGVKGYASGGYVGTAPGGAGNSAIIVPVGGFGAGQSLRAAAEDTAALRRETERLNQTYRGGLNLVQRLNRDTIAGLRESLPFWEAARGAVANMFETMAMGALDAMAAGAWDLIFGAFNTPGGGNWLSNAFSWLFPSAKGNAVANGAVVPMARGGAGSGGIISQPTFFPMRSGDWALGGELENEAILPLARTGSGELGVHVAGRGGAGGGQFSFVYAPNFNYGGETPPDAIRAAARESFDLLKAQFPELYRDAMRRAEI